MSVVKQYIHLNADLNAPKQFSKTKWKHKVHTNNFNRLACFGSVQKSKPKYINLCYPFFHIIFSSYIIILALSLLF